MNLYAETSRFPVLKRPTIYETRYIMGKVEHVYSEEKVE